MNYVKKSIVRLIFLGTIIGLWQLCAANRWVNPLYTGMPSGIVKATVKQVQLASFWHAMWITLQETLIGWVIGSIAGFVAAFIFTRFVLLRESLVPMMTSLNSLPRVALAPLFIIWFGLGEPSKIALSVSLVFFIMLSNCLAGLTSLDRDLLLLARSLRTPERKRIYHFVLPSAIPMIGAALELGLVFSVLGVVAGEFIGAKGGIGVLMNLQASEFEVNPFFASLIVLAFITTLLSVTVRRTQNRIAHWSVVEMRGTGVNLV